MAAQWEESRHGAHLRKAAGGHLRRSVRLEDSVKQATVFRVGSKNRQCPTDIQYHLFCAIKTGGN